MNKRYKMVMILSLACCAILLYSSIRPNLPAVIAMLSIISSQAIAADDDDDDELLAGAEESDQDDDNFAAPEDYYVEHSKLFDDNPTHHFENEMESGLARADDLNRELDSQGYIVKVAEILAIDADDTSLELIDALGFTVLRKQTLDALGISITIIETPAELSVRDAIKRLRQSDPDALYEFNHLYKTMSDIKQASQSQPPAIRQTNKTRIGLIDTGVDTQHPSLQASQIIQQNFVKTNALPMAHGTSIASLLVSESNHFDSLLPGATLYSAAVFIHSGKGEVEASADSLASALNWMVEQRVPVVNMSLAGPPNILLEMAVKKTLTHGHAIVAAVGNAGPAAPELYPAAYNGVIAVTAVDDQQRVYRRANRGQHVDFAAAGVKVLAADQAGGYATFTGTSYASPVVSAILARRLTSPSPEHQQQLYKQLQQQATDIGSAGHDPIFGYGLLSKVQHDAQ